MGAAAGLPGCGLLEKPIADRRQSVSGSIPLRRPAEPGPCGASGNRPRAGTPGAGDHRGRADNDSLRALSILRRLKALGVKIAMDDFGTGYASLSSLQSFP